MNSTEEPGPRVGGAGPHLQAALLELIAAGRATLDALETVVSRPDALEALGQAVGEVGTILGHAFRGLAAQGPPSSRSRPGRGGDGDDGGFERIRVS